MPNLLKSFYIKSSLPTEVKVVAWYLVVSIASFFLYTILLYLKESGIEQSTLIDFFKLDATPLTGFLIVATPITIVEVYALKKVVARSKLGFRLSLILILFQLLTYLLILFLGLSLRLMQLGLIDYLWTIFSLLTLISLIRSRHLYR